MERLRLFLLLLVLHMDLLRMGLALSKNIFLLIEWEL